MKAVYDEVKSYQRLNRLASPGGTVILGGTRDREIPMCELKQSFELQERLYNRSITGLTVELAGEVYEACVAPLAPESVLLHLGADDLERFARDPEGFERDYRAVLGHIRAQDRKCRVCVVSVDNREKAPVVAEMNRRLKNLAASEQCGFEDLEERRVWNPKGMREVLSFVSAMGLPAAHRSERDLVKVLFCYDMEESGPEESTEKARRSLNLFPAAEASLS